MNVESPRQQICCATSGTWWPPDRRACRSAPATVLTEYERITVKFAVLVSPCGSCPCATTRSPLPHRSIFDGLDEFFDSRPCSGREPPVRQQWWSGGACRGRPVDPSNDRGRVEV
jgi:hypothetical protein